MSIIANSGCSSEKVFYVSKNGKIITPIISTEIRDKTAEFKPNQQNKE
ncbi:hypothetical protein GIHI108528_12150 [Gillisia hiemivivida]|jgi:hypothetical protein